jgi:hypothetical protein
MNLENMSELLVAVATRFIVELSLCEASFEVSYLLV